MCVFCGLQVCQATLQLIDVLLQCPLAPVFLRELVFNGSPGPSTINFSKTTPPSPLPQAPHTPGTPHSPSHRFGATSTPLARSSNSNLARERKQLEHWITRSTDWDRTTQQTTHKGRESENKTEGQMLWPLFLGGKGIVHTVLDPVSVVFLFVIPFLFLYPLPLYPAHHSDDVLSPPLCI